MPTVVGKVTDLWQEKMARLYANDTSLGALTVPAEFKIGEGGFSLIAGIKTVKAPDPSRIVLEAPSLAVGDDYVFTKALVAGTDLTFTAPNRCEVRCFIDSAEANTDNLGNSPEFFEIGIFDSASVMLAYATFPVEIKTLSKTIEHIVLLDFVGA